MKKCVLGLLMFLALFSVSISRQQAQVFQSPLQSPVQLPTMEKPGRRFLPGSPGTDTGEKETGALALPLFIMQPRRWPRMRPPDAMGCTHFTDGSVYCPH